MANANAVPVAAVVLVMSSSLPDPDGEVRADAWAKEAVRMALVNLSAVAAPAGTMPVVLGAGWPACCCMKR
ncbi:hypothetical protein ACLB1T_08260 [Escherichia coli]